MRVRRSYFTVLKQDKDDTLDCRILNLEARLNKMAGELTALQAQAGQTTDKIQEAILLLNQLKAMVDDLQAGGVDPVALGNVTTTLKAATDALSAAITTNTPPPPVP